MIENTRLRIRPALLVVALAAAALAFALPGFASKPVEKIEFEAAWDADSPPNQHEPMPWEDENAKPPPGGTFLEDDTWIVETEGFTARLTQLTAEQRWTYIRFKTGAATDPFANTDPDSPGFLTFALELHSKTEGDLVLQPERCRLITNRHEFRHPLDLPMIETSYTLQESKMPEAYRQVRSALLDGEIILHNGDFGAGLLIYKGVDEKTKSFVVELLLTTPEGKVTDHKLPYQRIKAKKNKKED